VARLGKRTLALGLGAQTLGIFGLFLTATAAGNVAPQWIPLFLVFALIGFGSGLGGPTVMSFALADIPRQEAGSASGVMETTMQIGFALGVPLIGLVFFHASGGSTASAPGVVQGFIQSMLFLGCGLIFVLALIPFLIRFTRKDTQKN